jgi:hypothetical protein
MIFFRGFSSQYLEEIGRCFVGLKELCLYCYLVLGADDFRPLNQLPELETLYLSTCAPSKVLNMRWNVNYDVEIMDCKNCTIIP